MEIFINYLILQEEVQEIAHDVTAASADITVDSVRDHTNAPPELPQPELNINLQVNLYWSVLISYTYMRGYFLGHSNTFVIVIDLRYNRNILFKRHSLHSRFKMGSN